MSCLGSHTQNGFSEFSIKQTSLYLMSYENQCSMKCFSSFKDYDLTFNPSDPNSLSMSLMCYSPISCWICSSKTLFYWFLHVVSSNTFESFLSNPTFDYVFIILCRFSKLSVDAQLNMKSRFSFSETLYFFNSQKFLSRSSLSISL